MKLNKYMITSEMKRRIACESLSGRSSLISMSLSIGRIRPERLLGIAEVSPTIDEIKAAGNAGPALPPGVPVLCRDGITEGGSKVSGSFAVNLSVHLDQQV